MRGFESWTTSDVERMNAQRGVKPGDPRAVGAGQTGRTLSVTAKVPKYRNQRCIVGDEKFDSKREAEFWIALKVREAAGEIRDLKRQVPWALHCPITASTVNLSVEVCCYVADFQWKDTNGKTHVADAKGLRTQVYRLKAKWMALEYGVPIEEL